MSVEDKKMARLMLREIGRRSELDLSDVKVSVARYVGYVAGVIRPQMGCYISNPKEEIKAIHDLGMRVPGLRDVVVEATFDLGKAHKK